MSNSVPFIGRTARPSCGILFSTMSSFAMIFRRETTESFNSCGIVMIRCSCPSIRMRITILSSVGSKWISEAFSETARSIMEFTSRIIGVVFSWISCCL